MKIFIAILFSTFFSLFRVPLTSVTLTYGDLISFGILFYFADRLLKGELIIDTFAKLYIAWLVVLLLAALLNLSLFNGAFLNIFKTNLISLIYFIFIYNEVYKEKLDLRWFLLGTAVLCIAFLLKTWSELSERWSDAGFTSYQVFDSSLNLNTWGYILILFLCFFTYACLKGVYVKYFISACAVLMYFILFSVSRTAYIMSFLIFIWIFFVVKKVRLFYLIIPIIIMLLLPYALSVLPEQAMSFFDRKINTGQSDLLNTRLYLINIDPIVKFFNTCSPIQVLIGDSESIQHSFLSHTLIVSGIIGFLLYVFRYYYLVKTSLSEKKTTIESKYLILLVIVININDFITNTSSFLPFAGYLSAMLIALFLSIINNEEDHISDRI